MCYRGSTSTLALMSWAWVVQPAAVYVSWMVSPAFTEKLRPVAEPEPEPLATVAAVLLLFSATSCTKNCGIVVQPAGAESAITLMVVTFSGVLLLHCENTTLEL